MELIVVKNGSAELTKQAITTIVEMERELKKLKEKNEALKKQLLDAMLQNNVCKFETPEFTVQFIAPTFRETFDSKAFRKDNPDLYDEYANISPVKASVRVKLK